MQSFAIAEHFDVGKEPVSGFLPRGGNATAEVIEALGFECGPKTFHHGIVAVSSRGNPAFTTHALLHTVLLEKATKQLTGILALDRHGTR
jgi:hypothetical protein